MKTLKQWNEYIQKTLPELEMCKGDGYIYFSWSGKGTRKLRDMPESIYVPYINLLKKDWIDSAIKETLVMYNRYEVNERESNVVLSNCVLHLPSNKE